MTVTVRERGNDPVPPLQGRDDVGCPEQGRHPRFSRLLCWRPKGHDGEHYDLVDHVFWTDTSDSLRGELLDLIDDVAAYRWRDGQHRQRFVDRLDAILARHQVEP